MKKLLFLMIILSSCATIVHGPNQTIPITSYPFGAEVLVNNEVKGITPVSIKFQRSKDYKVQIVLQGYLPYETELIKEVDPLIIGNFLIGGLPGILIDAMTGSMFKFDETEIFCTFTK